MELALGYKRKRTFVEKLVSKKIVWFLFIVTIFSYPIYRSYNRVLPKELPKYFKVPKFTFINEFGKPFGSKDLKGKLYIASFMFTTCPTSCPKIMKEMQVIQKRVRGLGTNIGLVTFTVDPETDTPKILHKYARSLNANPFVWSFLTETKSKISNLLVQGLKVPIGEGKVPIVKNLDGNDITVYDIVHSEKFVLVDKEGYVRGYYGANKQDIDKLMIDVGLTFNRSSY